MIEIKDGYTCPACSKPEKYPPYVYAHYDLPLVHACDCGARNVIQYGELIESSKPKRKTKKEQVT